MRPDARIARCWHCGKSAVPSRQPDVPAVCCRNPKCIAAEKRYQRQLAGTRQGELIADGRIT